MENTVFSILNFKKKSTSASISLDAQNNLPDKSCSSNTNITNTISVSVTLPQPCIVEPNHVSDMTNNDIGDLNSEPIRPIGK